VAVPAKREPDAYLVILGDSAGLVWVLRNQQMAFTEKRAHLATAIEGDVLLLYATRGCFGNPTRDRGRVVGLGRTTSALRRKRSGISDRTFDFVQDFALKGVCARGEGVELATRVAKMRSFPDAKTWSAHLRKPLLRLDSRDAGELRSELEPLLRPLAEVIDPYERSAKQKHRWRAASRSSPRKEGHGKP
jgi:hypothetical protein